jgi:hypothetical protein
VSISGRIAIVLAMTLGCSSLLTVPAAAAVVWIPSHFVSTKGYAASVPQLAVDGLGTTFVAWRQATAGGIRQAKVAVHPGGLSWRTPVTLSRAGEHVSAGPYIAADARGNATVVWQVNTGPFRGVRASYKRAGGNWSVPVNLSTTGSSPVIAASDAATTVAYRQFDPVSGEIRIAARRRTNTAFEAADYVSPTGADAYTPSLAASSTGDRILLAWVYGARPGSAIQAAELIVSEGVGWREVVSLSALGEETGAPQAAVGTYNATVVWHQFGADDGLVMASRPREEGWTAPAYVVHAGAEPTTRPVLAVAPSGFDGVVAWQVADQAGLGLYAAPARPDASAVKLSDNASGTDVAVDRLGVPHLAWRDAGIWPKPRIVLQSGRELENPDSRRLLSADVPARTPHVLAPGGDVVIAWTQVDGPTHRVRVAARDGGGPITTVTAPTSRGQVATSFRVAWVGRDAWSSLKNYDVRVGAAEYNHEPEPWNTLVGATTSTSRTFTGTPGRTFCFAARARDVNGNLGQMSPHRCTTTPVDDRTAVAAGTWSRTLSSAAYQGTLTSTTKTGATLTLTGVRAQHLSLVAQKCPGCGAVNVNFGGTYLGTFDLSAPEVRHKQLVTIGTLSSVQTGDLVVEVVSAAGQPVRLDGFVAGRSF